MADTREKVVNIIREKIINNEKLSTPEKRVLYGWKRKKPAWYAELSPIYKT